MKTLKTSEVLTKAKQLIINPDNWMKGDYTDGQGCFCSLGAVAKVSSVDWFLASSSPAGKLLRQVVSDELKGYTLDTNFAAFNDDHTHAEVMEAFDKAITLAQIQEVT